MQSDDAAELAKILYDALQKVLPDSNQLSYEKMHSVCKKAIDKTPDWRNEKLVEMLRWERDIAISQLNELGYQFGEKIRESDKAPDKEIATKPIKNNKLKGFYSCPKCAYGLRFSISKNTLIPFSVVDNYCPNCGQKIDWSDYERE